MIIKKLLAWVVFIAPIYAQMVLPLKIDDFNSTKSWWEYHKDGLVARDEESILNGEGYLKIRLLNPQDHLECNVGISERQPIYGKNNRYLSYEVRFKVLNSMLGGSRGWGFWNTARQGKADNVAWFMEQYLEKKPELSWSRIGTISRNKVDLRDISIETDKWYVHRTVRNLMTKNTEYYINGKLYYTSNGIAPFGKMAFHLWVDNQVYSRSKGIIRAAWQGTSELVVDYVKIQTQPLTFPRLIDGYAIKLNERPRSFGNEGLNSKNITVDEGITVLLVSARLESFAEYDIPDELEVVVSTGEQSFKIDGFSVNTPAETKTLIFKNYATELNINFKSVSTPYVSDIVVLNSKNGEIILDEKINASPEKNGLWREFPFTSNGQPLVIYLSGSANESKMWNHIDLETHNDNTDDDLKIVIADRDFGWNTDAALDGNQQFGLNRAVVIREQLPAGNHRLKLYTENKPYVSRLLIFQE